MEAMRDGLGKVFITGSTGFIGSHTVQVMLEAGYPVRVSYRQASQKGVLQERYKAYASQLDFVLLPDLTDTDAVRGVLHDVKHIFHLASPMPGKGADLFDDYICPAIRGTQAVLQAASSTESIDLVIVMSSIVALIEPDAMFSPSVQVKANALDRVPVNVNTALDGPAGHGMKYAMSKILAHQSQRDFVQSKAPKYKLISFHPSFVLGHDLTQGSEEGPKGINSLLWDSLRSPRPLIPTAWVGVTDVAKTHLMAVQKRGTLRQGAELIVSAPQRSWGDAANFVREKFPNEPWILDPQTAAEHDSQWCFDASDTQHLLGHPWQSMEDILSEVMAQQLSKV